MRILSAEFSVGSTLLLHTYQLKVNLSWNSPCRC